MSGWLPGVQALTERGEAGVLVTLAAVRGHAPREAGAKMVVSVTQTWDTVGGGNLEATAVARARALLETGTSAPELLTLRLTDRAPNEYGRQCCGGEVTLLLEPLRTAFPVVALFGIGHVGLELGLLLSRHPVELHLTDSRAAQLTPERLAPLRGGPARLHVHHSPIPEMALAELPPGACAVFLTHDHAEDLALCDAALHRGDLAFTGLIGSAVKWSRFREQLRAAGHTPEAISTITCPVGLPGLGGKAPAVTALSIAAQLYPLLFPAVPAPSPERTP